MAEQIDRTERLIDEGLVGMAEIAGYVGKFRAGRPTHTSTITRWCLNGVRLGGGRMLRLESVRIGGRLMSSRAALLRFISAQQDGLDDPPRTPTECKRSDARAAEELETLGV